MTIKKAGLCLLVLGLACILSRNAYAKCEPEAAYAEQTWNDYLWYKSLGLDPTVALDLSDAIDGQRSYDYCMQNSLEED